MIIRTIDNVFVNLNNITRIKFKVDSSDQILIERPIKEEGEEDFYTADYPLADMYIDPEGLLKIRDMFIEALEKNKPYFDFRDAFVEAFKSPTEKIDAMESIKELYDGRKCD